MFTGPDIGVAVSVFFISILTTVGGVGGGGLLIPLYSLAGGFTIEETIPLSVATILGDSFVRVIFLYNREHPYHKSRYLVDMLPIILITLYDSNTSILGIVLTNVLPSFFTIICIILVLSVTFVKSLQKAIQTYQKETIVIQNEETHVKLIIDGLIQYIPREVIVENATIDGVGDTLSKKIVHSGILTGVMGIMTVFSFFRPTNMCSTFFWGYFAIQIVVVGLFGYGLNQYILYVYTKRKDENYIFLTGDIVWNQKNINKFVIIGSVTGMLSTYMGIGGGMITTPVMIQLGMIPEVVIGSSAVTTFLSSLISVINYVISDKLLVEYAVLYGTVSCGGSLVGIWLSTVLLNRLKRQSVIIFVVSLILFISMILMIYNSIIGFIDNPEIAFEVQCISD